MKLYAIVFSSLWLVSYGFASSSSSDATLEKPVRTKQVKAVKIAPQYDLAETFLHILRAKYNDEHPQAGLEIKAQPDILSKEFLVALASFAQDVPFVDSKGEPVVYNMDKQNKPCIRMSSVDRYNDKKDFLMHGIRAYKSIPQYKTTQDLDSAFEAYQQFKRDCPDVSTAFKDNLCGSCKK